MGFKDFNFTQTTILIVFIIFGFCICYFVFNMTNALVNNIEKTGLLPTIDTNMILNFLITLFSLFLAIYIYIKSSEQLEQKFHQINNSMNELGNDLIASLEGIKSLDLDEHAKGEVMKQLYPTVKSLEVASYITGDTSLSMRIADMVHENLERIKIK